RNKPATLKDTCWDRAGVPHEEPFNLEPSSVCNTIYPIFATVRIAAGANLGGDILKCTLKPIDFQDYAVTFTSAEQRRLKAMFPQGVCDYTRRGVQQQPVEGTWIDFSDVGG